MYIPDDTNETEGGVKAKGGCGGWMGGGRGEGRAAGGAVEGPLMGSTQFQGTQWSSEPIFPKRQIVFLSCAPTIR